MIFSVNDNNELAGRADLLLVRMCGVTPPRSLISPMLDSIFRAIQTSPVGFTGCVVRMFLTADWTVVLES